MSLRRTWLVPLLLILSAALWLNRCTPALFWPLPDWHDDPRLSRFQVVPETLTTPDGEHLAALWITPKPPSQPKGVVLFMHGNAGNISYHWEGFLWLVEAGYGVLVFDYRGYGDSTGIPTLTGIHVDGATALSRAAQLHRPIGGPLIVFGQSLGSAVATLTVAHAPEKGAVAGLLLDGAFARYAALGREHWGNGWLTWPLQYPLSWLVPGGFDPVDAIGAVVPVPILMLAGEGDRVVPLRHSVALHEVASASRLIRVPGAEHLGTLDGVGVKGAVLGWLAGLSEGKP